jgi:hypothetical protein
MHMPIPLARDGVPTPEAAARRRLLHVERHLAPLPRIHYIDHPFQVPEGASKVGLSLSFHKQTLAQLFISLHDPHGFRGNRMNPGAKGDIVLTLWVAPDDASEGGIVGPLPAGQWRAQLDIEALGEETDYVLEVYAELGPVAPPGPPRFTYPADHVVKAEPGWYKGELHAHSTESDGQQPLETVVQAAVDAGLAFIAMSEHFTISQWRKQAQFVNGPLALLRSCEVTSHHGHVNMHGLREWVDVYVDRPGWDMNEVADAVHSQGGLFCVNHAFSGALGWRAYDFDWSKADLMEIYHNLEGPNNHFQTPLWDHHLRLGRRIVGVAGIDSHHAFDGLHRLGQLVTWVQAQELSERGILEGLRRGRVYLSRGPELRFTATDSAGHTAEMWESLPLGGGPVTLRVQLKSSQPVRLFVLRDGYPMEMLASERPQSAWQTFTLVDEPRQPAYYRLEVHSIVRSELYRFIQWRDFATTQALSNPIWVGRSQLRQFGG